MTDEGISYKKARYKEIIEEQVAISYASKGGVSISDTDLMTPYDRELILKSILKIKEQENKIANERSSQNTNVRRSTSRF